MKLSDITIEELKGLIYEAVEEKLKEILGDPDEGLELREDIEERLRRSLEAVERGEGGMSFQEVASRLGLER